MKRDDLVTGLLKSRRHIVVAVAASKQALNGHPIFFKTPKAELHKQLTLVAKELDRLLALARKPR